jgi:N-dimethylarginine dimethylaminohydrolase
MTTCFITTANQWRDHTPRSMPAEAAVTGALLCPPEHFDVVDIRNAHMEGQIGSIDKQLAHSQWTALVDAIESLGLSIHLLPARLHLVDSVFTANPSLVTNDSEGNPCAIIGRMSHPNRTEENALHRIALEEIGVRCEELPPECEGCWEGNGDTLKHPGRAVIWCGVGSRSSAACHRQAGVILGHDVALLNLTDPCFYHLDTALAIIDRNRAAVVRRAFDDEGLALLEEAFEQLIEVDESEAKEQLAGNLWCPDGQHVLMPSNAPVTRERLIQQQLDVVEIDTGEFLKSGGSVFCMRQEIRESV